MNRLFTAGAACVVCAGTTLAATSPGNETSTIPAALAEDFSKVYWKNDLRFETADKQFTTRIGGRIQFDGVYTDDGDQTAGSNGSRSDGWEFRRARLYIRGTVYGNVHYKAQYDFAGNATSGPASSAVDWKDVYIKIDELVGPLYLQVGQFYAPFGLETQVSSNDITFLERDPITTFSVDRSTGLATGGSFSEGNGTWKVGLFNTASGSDGNAVGGYYEAAARATYKFDLDDGGSFLHGGLAYATGSRGGTTTFSARPGVHLGNNLASSGALAASGLDRMGVELAGVVGAFSAQAEYMSVDVDTAATDPTLDGFYVQGSYFLTADTRPYSDGLFGSVKPTDPWRGWGNGTGAWELAARYSTFDVSEAAAGQELTLITLGVNWYLNSNMRIMLNYATGENDTTPSVDQDSYAVRFQVTF